MKSLILKLIFRLWGFLPLDTKASALVSLATKNIGYLDYNCEPKVKIGLASHMAASRLTSCEKEPATIKWIEQNLKKGQVFYDIGANIGAYSLAACAKTAGKAKIYAFEPGFSTFPELCKNICLNGFQNSIIPLNIALSAKLGFEDFIYQSIESGAAEHTGLGNNSNTSQSVKTGVFSQKMFIYTLDELVKTKGLEPATHIKIDVDGHELKVLEGARATLAGASVKSVQVEVDVSTKEATEILKLMDKLGFFPNKKNRHSQSNIYDFIFIKKEPK